VSEVDATKVQIVATIRVGGASDGIALGSDGAPWIAARKA